MHCLHDSTPHIHLAGIANVGIVSPSGVQCMTCDNIDKSNTADKERQYTNRATKTGPGNKDNMIGAEYHYTVA